jgi:hypothetical protein
MIYEGKTREIMKAEYGKQRAVLPRNVDSGSAACETPPSASDHIATSVSCDTTLLFVGWACVAPSERICACVHLFRSAPSRFPLTVCLLKQCFPRFTEACVQPHVTTVYFLCALRNVG